MINFRFVVILLLIFLTSSIDGKRYARRSVSSTSKKVPVKEPRHSKIFTSWVRFPSLISNAIRQSLHEQEVEDINALYKVDNRMQRRLIVMPLTDSFKPHQADIMHGKIQYGDKCSLPASIGRLIYENQYEAPWIFELKPVRNEIGIFTRNDSSSLEPPSDPRNMTNTILSPYFRRGKLTKAYISPLDFRSPENFIFLPEWLMKDLNLQVNDIVEISLLRMKLASLVTFQPLTFAWDELMKEYGDPKALLEQELNKYASLTAGSTIAINIHGKEYPFYVKEVYSEGGISVHGVRIQDSDVRTDIDRSVLTALEDATKHQEEDTQKTRSQEQQQQDRESFLV